jgi:hypothetical protein
VEAALAEAAAEAPAAASGRAAALAAAADSRPVEGSDMAARVERLVWRDIPQDAIDLPKAKLLLTVGLGSGLSRRSGDAAGRVFAVTDRGPNLFVSSAIGECGLAGLEHLRAVRDAKIMPRPDEGPEIHEMLISDGRVGWSGSWPLRTRTRRFSGLPLPGDTMEAVFDMQGRPLGTDTLGADTEAIAAMPDGGFFLAEEYGPSLLKVDAEGVVSERWVAAGQEKVLAHRDLVVRGVLPEAAMRRRANRGFEALCASADGAWLYVGFQSAVVGENERSAPVWKLDARTGALAGEWRYPFDEPSSFRRDAARRKVGLGDLKICEFAWAGEDRLVVLERIAHSTKIYAVDLKRLSEKRLLLSSDDHPEIGPDIEGMALLSPTEILLSSDNDFGVEGAETGFWRVTPGEAI